MGDLISCCITSVENQITPEAWCEGGNVKRGKVKSVANTHLHTFEPSNLMTARSPLVIERIVQYGGTLAQFSLDEFL